MRLCFKSFVAGTIVATVGVATVFAASSISSVAFNENKVVFDGKALDLSAQPMVSLIKDGETNASNYMPLRGVLEAMGYEVSWDGTTKTVSVNTKKAAVGVEQAPTTNVPTSALLEGQWDNTTDGVASIFAFDKDGKFCWYMNAEDTEEFYSGVYEIKDDFVIVTINYENIDGVSNKLAASDEMVINMRVAFAEDGKSWTWTDENIPVTFSKMATQFDFTNYLPK